MYKKKYIDLNCDVGEFHPQTGVNNDDKIIPYISSCNVCCTYHSGSAFRSAKTIKIALNHNVAIGAHPSYNDKKNFGRISLNTDLNILKEELRFQIGAIKSMTESLGGQLSHVKPHGALYNDMTTNLNIANVITDLIIEINPNLKLYGLADSNVKTLCEHKNITYVNEAFADRQYDYKTQLRSRHHHDAVVKKPQDIISQLNQLLNNKIVDLNGNMYNINVDSICLHSDTPDAIALVQLIYNHLKSSDVELLSIK